MPTIHNEGERAQLALIWLNWADNDYIAARLLLRQGLLTQGTTLANTALEKYFKTLFVVLNKKVPHGHDITILYQQICKEITSLKLDEEYLSLLFKAYKLRYPDDLKPHFNIVINSVSMLTELDRCVFEIRKGFTFGSVNNKPITTAFDDWKEASSSELVGDNCYFGTASRTELFRGTSTNYEFRVLGNGTFLEVTYLSENIPDNGNFMLEGLKPSNNVNAEPR
jgi:HEPN domain-containing protein